MKIKYNNMVEFYNIDDFNVINFERTRLFGVNIPENTSGFDIYDDDENLLHSCQNHNVVYEVGEDFVEYTNDTYTYYIYYLYDNNNFVTDIFSSWHDSMDNGILVDYGKGKKYAKPTTDLIFIDKDGFYNYKVVDGKIIEITVEEKDVMKAERAIEADKASKLAFENNKIDKIKESKDLLALYLENHPLVSKCHNGMEARYNVTLEKQSLMTSHYATYSIEKELGANPVLKWNSTGAEYEEWTEEEFVSLMLEIKAYVEPLVTLQQSYEVQIRNCITQEELDAIGIMYEVYGITE
ncbi:MAG: hypothetical protein IJE49_11315 [Agathobacter sp.]|nr:hypothetical protein [Agathobacter sp.]